MYVFYTLNISIITISPKIIKIKKIKIKQDYPLLHVLITTLHCTSFSNENATEMVFHPYIHTYHSSLVTNQIKP